MPKTIDLSGHTYNNLTVIKRDNRKTANGQWRWICRCACGKDRQAAAYKKYQRECYDRFKYKLEPEHKQAMLDSQGGACAICRYRFGQKIGDVHVDHCHGTGVVRGLLCDRCNRGLGYFRDNPESLQAASQYIKRFAR